MKYVMLAAGLLLASPALAGQCPLDMQIIDAALESASLSEAETAKIMQLRALGEAQHDAGDHAASVATLAAARALLGVS